MSNTKPVTAAAAMMLLEEGLFRLDDPLAWHLPGWGEQRVWVSGSGEAMVTEAAHRPVMVCDGFRHTAGLTYGRAFQQVPEGEEIHPVDAEYKRLHVDLARDVPMTEFVRRVSQVPPRYQPGEGWVYSMASDVVWAFVEAVSGVPFEDFLQTRIFNPLGMPDTGFHVPPETVSRFAASYSPTPDGGIRLYDDPQTSPYLEKPALCSGGGRTRQHVATISASWR